MLRGERLRAMRVSQQDVVFQQIVKRRVRCVSRRRNAGSRSAPRVLAWLGPRSCAWKRLPQTLSNLLQVVTQWKSARTRTRGRDWNSTQLSSNGLATKPATEKRHEAGSNSGTAPTCSTGHLRVRDWPAEAGLRRGAPVPTSCARCCRTWSNPRVHHRSGGPRRLQFAVSAPSRISMYCPAATPSKRSTVRRASVSRSIPPGGGSEPENLPRVVRRR